MICKMSFFLVVKSSALWLGLAVCLESPITKYEAGAAKWEDEVAALIQSDSVEIADSDDILFLGSSSIRLWKSIKQDMAPWTAVSRGYGGAKFSDLAIYTQRLIAAHYPRAIVIFAGNDISSDTDLKTPEEIVVLVNHITTTIHNQFPNVEIFFVGITPTSSRWNLWPEISAANLAIKEYCNSKASTHFISTARSYLNEQGMPRDELFEKDRLHQNGEGYALWSSIIKRDLGNVFQNKQ